MIGSKMVFWHVHEIIFDAKDCKSKNTLWWILTEKYNGNWIQWKAKIFHNYSEKLNAFWSKRNPQNASDLINIQIDLDF